MSLTITSPSVSTQVVPGRTSPNGRTGLVDIVSGSFGAGHDAAAREIALRLEARGYATRTWDIVDLMPGHLGRILRAGTCARSSPFRPPGAGRSTDSNDTRLWRGPPAEHSAAPMPHCSPSPPTEPTPSSRHTRSPARPWATFGHRVSSPVRWSPT